MVHAHGFTPWVFGTASPLPVSRRLQPLRNVVRRGRGAPLEPATRSSPTCCNYPNFYNVYATDLHVCLGHALHRGTDSQAAFFGNAIRSVKKPVMVPPASGTIGW
jgi:hypothetical protein